MQLPVDRNSSELDEQPPIMPPKSEKAGRLDTSGIKGQAIVSAIVTIVILMLMSFAGGAMFVTKSDFTSNWETMTVALEEAQKDLETAKTSVDTAVQGIPAVLTSQINTAVTQSTSQWSSQLAYVQDGIQQLNTAYNNNANSIATLQGKITTLEGKITTLETQIEELEEDYIAPSEAEGGDEIPGVDIDVKITDEGTFYSTYGASSNITISEFKLTLDNTGVHDIEDVVLYVYLWFDNCSTANQGIISSSYGSWSVRERQRDEVQIKGRLSRLIAGESRRVYIVMASAGTNNDVTYMDVSSNDVDVVDWNYED